MDSVDAGVGTIPPVRGAHWRGMFLAASALVVLLVAALMVRNLSTTESAPIRLVNPTQVTSALGVEDHPMPSPDGELLAYQSFESGNWDVWVTQVDEGQSANRTADYAGADLFPSWSPDSRQIAFLSEREGGGVFVMPMLGGIPRKVANLQRQPRAGHGRVPQWSPNGTELAFLDSVPNEEWLEIVSVQTGESRRLALPGAALLGRMDLTWSSDGRYLAYVAGNHTLEVNRVWVLRLADGKAVPVTDDRWNDHSPTWSVDGRTLFFVSNRGGSRDLWQQRLSDDGEPVGVARAVTAGVGISHAAMSLDGSRLVYAKGGPVANVWRVRLLADRQATWADAEQITFDEAFVEFLDVSPNGERLLINSDRRGNMDLWVLPSTGGDVRQLTTDPLPDWGPRWSPDETEIVFFSYRSGTRDVWTMSASGGPPRQITHNELNNWYPSWSSDGREILFWEYPNGLWVVPAEGGEPRQVTSIGAFPDWSPDGEWIAFGGQRS